MFIIFGDDTPGNIPAQKGDDKPLNTLASPKAEETENSPTFHQSARKQAQSQFLTETTKEFTDSNDSNYTKDGYIFLADYNSGTESHASVQEKHSTDTRHNAEITAGDVLAGNDELAKLSHTISQLYHLKIQIRKKENPAAEIKDGKFFWNTLLNNGKWRAMEAKWQKALEEWQKSGNRDKTTLS